MAAGEPGAWAILARLGQANVKRIRSGVPNVSNSHAGIMPHQFWTSRGVQSLFFSAPSYGFSESNE